MQDPQSLQLLPDHQANINQGADLGSSMVVSEDTILKYHCRLMKFSHDLRQVLTALSMSNWRNFVKEYYSPSAMKRWCFSTYANEVGNDLGGILRQINMGNWQCDICGTPSGRGRGFEATFEVLARLHQTKAADGVKDEIIFLDNPILNVLPHGQMMLKYKKAVAETIHEQFRIVHEGHIHILFDPDLKISSWQFCIRRHQVLVPTTLASDQVNQIRESRSFSDFGFSRRMVNALQTSKVLCGMKDLIDFSIAKKIGPIEALNTYADTCAADKEMMKNLENMPIDEDFLGDFRATNM